MGDEVKNEKKKKGMEKKEKKREREREKVIAPHGPFFPWKPTWATSFFLI